MISGKKAINHCFTIEGFVGDSTDVEILYVEKV